MAIRSSVSADISAEVIWVNSTDFKSTVKAVKIHQLLVEHLGYMDSSILEESERGEGVSLSVCDGETVKQMRDDYAWAKAQERNEATTEHHLSLAKDYLAQLYR
ncbi:hypothetical protein [Enterovibrio norvegicus]|uniref:hypothetical protein n=1 Tax=Enterovibrio norvegicus TaxID=188144 RepID=UPI000C8359A4|nr:hypothetical protein [Enterovibrio norvegicus]PMH64472.1 hypothetical protein BCU62_15570 [Enterovibrio norvegicus]